MRALRIICAALVACIIPVFMTSCSKNGTGAPSQAGKTLRLSTTTSTQNSGLLDYLLPVFEKQYGMTVKVAAVGSGAALDRGRDGKADVILSHARVLEDKFIAEGYGINAVSIMYNDFVLVGPPEDPAGLKKAADAKAAFRDVYFKKAPFISRGDRSGTQVRELELWKLAGVTPNGDWYKQSKKGMLKTLQMASKEKSYCLSDRSTYLSHKNELHLQIVFQGDKRLFNPYRVTAVNPAKVPGVNYKGAMLFIDFLKSDSAQKLIAEYGIKKFGQAIFHPLVLKKLP